MALDKWLEWKVEYLRDLDRIVVTLFEFTKAGGQKWPFKEAVGTKTISLKWFLRWRNIPKEIRKAQDYLMRRNKSNRDFDEFVTKMCTDFGRGKFVIRCRKTSNFISSHTSHVQPPNHWNR